MAEYTELNHSEEGHRRTRKRPKGKVVIQQTIIYSLLFGILALVLLPLMWAFSASFTPNQKVFEYVFPFTWRAFFPVDFTLEAYVAIFTRPGGGFGRPIIVTLVLAFATVILAGAMSALAGFAFARFEFRGKNLLFGLVMLTLLIPFEVTLVPMYIAISRLGFVNTWAGLIVPGLASALVIFVFRQFFAEIPQDLIDAARVDGASWMRLLARIILPMSKPVMITAGLLLFLSQWNNFFWPLLVAPKEEFRVVQVAVSYAYEEYGVQWNQLMAGATLAALVPILLILPFQRYFVSGMVGSGLKE